MKRNAKALVVIIKYGTKYAHIRFDRHRKVGTIDVRQKARGKHALAPGVKHC